jgi:hypothetical protein
VSRERFELEMLGGTTERRYRRLAPSIEDFPWGTLDLSGTSPEQLIVARKAWTGAAYQEQRTGVACAMTLRAMMEACAPLDLVGQATRFPLDEMVHVELCARMAAELGGATEVLLDPEGMVLAPNARNRPLMRAAECAVRFFCVGEAVSIPLLRETWHIATHPLPKAVMGRIVKDEAAHGTFGFTFLDWALPHLTDSERQELGAAADLGIRTLREQWDALARNPRKQVHEGDVLGWMTTDAYLTLAERSLTRLVIAPLEARGIPLLHDSCG